MQPGVRFDIYPFLFVNRRARQLKWLAAIGETNDKRTPLPDDANISIFCGTVAHRYLDCQSRGDQAISVVVGVEAQERESC